MAPNQKRISRRTASSREGSSPTESNGKVKARNIPQKKQSSARSSSSSSGSSGEAEVRPKRVARSKRQFSASDVVAPATKKRRTPLNEEVHPTYTGAGVSTKDKIRVLKGHYTVEKILDKKLVDGNAFYLVKWKNYKPSGNTWEPLRHFSPELIQQWEETQNQQEPTSSDTS